MTVPRQEVAMFSARLPWLVLLAFALAATPAAAAVDPARPEAATGRDEPKGEDPTYRRLEEAAGAVVTIRTRALDDARSKDSLGAERTGSGVLIAPSGLVLTIGYLVLEADQVDVTDSLGRTLPASVVAYDHATGFGLLRPIGPLAPKPIALGSSAGVAEEDRLMVVAGGEGGGITVATVVSRRPFAGYWEYLIDGAIFTAPPRIDHSGAALIDRHGELVGIGSLLVMDAVTPGERFPGNMFVPVDLLKPVLQEMIDTGRQKAGRRPWIGINTIEDEGRLRVLRVSADGPADRAGVRAGDLILSLDGKAIRDLADFYRRLWASGEPGTEVSLTLLQGAQLREIRVQSIDRHDFLRRKPTI